MFFIDLAVVSNSTKARYRTMRPALVTILFWRWEAGMFRSLSAALPDVPIPRTCWGRSFLRAHSPARVG